MSFSPRRALGALPLSRPDRVRFAIKPVVPGFDRTTAIAGPGWTRRELQAAGGPTRGNHPGTARRYAS